MAGKAEVISQTLSAGQRPAAPCGVPVDGMRPAHIPGVNILFGANALRVPFDQRDFA